MTTINDIEFILPCAGHSTRNYPQSKGLPHKALLPFGSYRLIDHILKDIFNAGGKHITIIVSNEEIIHAFKHAFADDSDVQNKLKARGRDDMAQVLKSVAIPEDADIKYVIQEEALGTAQCIALAHDVAENRHGLMIFPDDIYLSADENNTNLQKLINNFLTNDKRILMQGIKQDDVSNNAILVDGRFIEKPKNPNTNIGGFSPIVIPNEVMGHIHSIMPSFVNEGKEWFHVDGMNDFLDNNEKASEYTVEMPVKDDEDLYMDVGDRSLYEKAFLYSLLTISDEKEKHLEELKKFIK